VTSTFLLVDRTQDRNIRITAEYLLVDGQPVHDINTQVLALLVDGRETSDIYTQSVYLIVDYEDAFYVADTWSILSEYTYELDTGATERDFEDIWSLGSNYDIIYVMAETWALTDSFTVVKTHRADVYAYMMEIINYLNLGEPTHPAPEDAYLDFNDDGHITPLDVALVQIWYEYGIIYKYARPTWPITVTAYNWSNTPVSLTQNWVITGSFTVDTQKLGIADTWSLTSIWNNPGQILRTQNNTWVLTDSFIVSNTDQRWNEVWSLSESWDLADKERVLTTAWTLSDSWSLTNLTDDWVLVDSFTLGAITPEWLDTWVLTSTFKGPIPVTFSDTWALVDTYSDADAHGTWVETWALSETWKVSPLSVGWSDLMNRAIWLGGLDTQMVFGLGSWLSYTLDSARSFADIINWNEQWRLEKSTESLTTTWSLTSEFTNEILWGSFEDTISFTETWNQVASTDEFISEFVPVSTFNVLHDAVLSVNIGFDLTSNFAAYVDELSWVGCLVLPTSVLTLIDTSESLILRNAEFGNTTTVDTTRAVGTSRSGTPYVYRESYWPEQSTYTYIVRALTDAQCDSLLLFIERNIGCKISWVDHYGVRRFGILSVPATSITRQSKRRSSTELILIKIPAERHTLIDAWALSEAWVCL
jgi:hypothetical protein